MRLRSLLEHIDYFNAGICGLRLKLLLNQLEALELPIGDLDSTVEGLFDPLTSFAESYPRLCRNVLGIFPSGIARKVNPLEPYLLLVDVLRIPDA